ncbi:hypothetical protein QNE66_004386 [Vibrio vulnificus]|nr:hypothetical protein [Vibrio vulnificus]
MSMEGAKEKGWDILSDIGRGIDYLDDALDDNITFEEGFKGFATELGNALDDFIEWGEEVAEETQPYFDRAADAVVDFFNDEN